MKLIFSYLKWFILIFVLILGGYLAYLFLDYQRLEDNLELHPSNQPNNSPQTEQKNYIKSSDFVVF